MCVWCLGRSCRRACAAALGASSFVSLPYFSRPLTELRGTHTPKLHPLHPPPALQVRAWMGVQQQPEAAGLDGFNLAAAYAFLCYALFVSLTGKKV